MITEEDIGTRAVDKDFGDMGLEETPIFEKFEDESVEGMPEEPPEELEPKQDLSTYVYPNASIILPQGDRIYQGKVVRHKIDVDGNPIVREKQNPVLDNHQYEVDLTDGEVIEITDNVIPVWMYAQCDKD